MMQRLRPLIIQSPHRTALKSTTTSVQELASSFSILVKPSTRPEEKRSTCIAISHAKLRTFSTNASTEPRSRNAVNINDKKEVTDSKQFHQLLSVTHSRHHEPPIAPFEDIQKLSVEILSSPLGSLYSFDENDHKIYEHPHDISDELTQRVEFILRGHSALIPNSILDFTSDERFAGQRYIPNADTEPDRYKAWKEERTSMSIKDRLVLMKQLIRRLEEEGEHYQKRAEEYRLALLAPTISIEDDEKATSTPTLPLEFQPKYSPPPVKTIFERYSSPGPSIHMYDLLLDAYAICAEEMSKQINVKSKKYAYTAPNSEELLMFLKEADSVYQKAKQRHDVDGRHNNINPKTILTPITFNALIRIASSIPYIQENTVENLSKLKTPTLKIRDSALTIGLRTYEEMHACDCVDRNSQTYKYVFNVVKKFIPECRSRGHLVRGFFQQAIEDGVVNQVVIHALIDNGGGQDYKEWLTNEILDKDLSTFPRNWTFLAKKRQYKQGNGLY